MIHTINDYCDDCKLPAEKTVHAHNAREHLSFRLSVAMVTNWCRYYLGVREKWRN